MPCTLAAVLVYYTYKFGNIVLKLQGYLKNLWTNTRLVCTHLNAFSMLNSNMSMIIWIWTIFGQSWVLVTCGVLLTQAWGWLTCSMANLRVVEWESISYNPGTSSNDWKDYRTGQSWRNWAYPIACHKCLCFVWLNAFFIFSPGTMF